MNTRFRLIAPPPTPFHQDGSLNLDIVESQASLLLHGDVDGVFVAGSTGECSSLTCDERRALARRWVDVCRSTELDVVVQVGHNCQADAEQLAVHAQAIGADAISAHAPCYFKPENVAQLIDFLAPIAQAAGDLPFYFYDIPGMTGVQLDMVGFLSAGKSRIPNLVGLKYSHLDLMQLQRCVELQDAEFEMLFGCDQALLSGVVLGARGAVGSTYNFAAPWYRRMIAALDAGDLEGARRRQASVAAWVATMVEYGFLAACKVILDEFGVACGPVRPPLANITHQQRDEILSRLGQQGFFAAMAEDHEAVWQHPHTAAGH